MYGHCNVPSRYAPHPELGIWVTTQRTQYRLFVAANELGENNPGMFSMNELRVRRLEDLGFVWTLKSPDKNREADVYDSIEQEVLQVAGELTSDLALAGFGNHNQLGNSTWSHANEYVKV
jgi:hypothetical protein